MTNASDDWTACGPQEITKLAARLRGRRQLRAARRAAFIAAATTATMAIVGLAVWSSAGTDEGPDFAGISCQRVAELEDAYMKTELPPELQDQVRRHVALCRICRDRMDAMPAVSWHHHHGSDGPTRPQPLVLASRDSSP